MRRSQHNVVLLVFLAFSALTFAACAAEAPSPPAAAPEAPTPAASEPAADRGLDAPDDAPSLESLAGTAWRLAQLGRETRVPAEVEITLAFEEGRVSGSAGCNSYTANVESTAPGELKIGPVAATRMMCPGGVMAYEDPYVAALGKVRRIGRDGERLVLTWEAESGEDTLRFAPVSNSP